MHREDGRQRPVPARPARQDERLSGRGANGRSDRIADRRSGAYRPGWARPPGADPQVTYSVHFVADLASIAEPGRAELQRTMQNVAEAVSAIPPVNPFWASISSSVLQIDAAGFRLLYRVLPRSREIHVIEITRLHGR